MGETRAHWWPSCHLYAPDMKLISDEIVAAGAGFDPGVDLGAGALLQRAFV